MRRLVVLLVVLIIVLTGCGKSYDIVEPPEDDLVAYYAELPQIDLFNSYLKSSIKTGFRDSELDSYIGSTVTTTDFDYMLERIAALISEYNTSMSGISTFDVEENIEFLSLYDDTNSSVTDMAIIYLDYGKVVMVEFIIMEGKCYGISFID